MALMSNAATEVHSLRSLTSDLVRHLQEPTDGAVIFPVLILLGDTEHGYGHLRGSIGVGG